VISYAAVAAAYAHFGPAATELDAKIDSLLPKDLHSDIQSDFKSAIKSGIQKGLTVLILNS
jgi:hypothetical protein